MHNLLDKKNQKMENILQEILKDEENPPVKEKKVVKTKWLAANLIKYKVLMEDGYVDEVKSIDAFTARMQCSHLKLIHGEVIKVEEIK